MPSCRLRRSILMIMFGTLIFLFGAMSSHHIPLFSIAYAEPDHAATVIWPGIEEPKGCLSLDEAFAYARDNGGTITILKDNQTLSNCYSFTNDVVIEGNNHTVTVQYTNTADHFIVEQGTFILRNITLKASPRNGNGGAMFIIHPSATVELQNSVIRDISIDGSASGASVFAIYGSLLMRDSCIENCRTLIPLSTFLVHGKLDIMGGCIRNCGYFGTTTSPGYFDAPISNCGYSIGGGFRAPDAEIVIDSVTFENNGGCYGGAICLYNCTGTPEKKNSIKNTTFSGNTGYNYAGAIFVMNSKINLQNSRFLKNAGNNVGAVFSQDCSISLTDDEFMENRSVKGSGGAIYQNGGSVSLTNTVFKNNKAASKGGGIYKTGSGSVLTMDDKTVLCNNAADVAGSDFFNNGGSNVSLPSAKNMRQTFQNTRFVIDGWYDDTSTRWDYKKALTYGNTYLGDTWSINGQKGFIAAFRAHSVKLSGGANATVSGGDTSQAVHSGAMTTVTYTAADGYRFEDFPDIVVNGITAKRISGTVVTVFGTPNENASITIPDAMKKDDAAVTVVPQIRTLTYSGSAQELVTAGAAEGGTMQYALGTNDTSAPVEGWGASIPKGTDAGTYYVWFRVVGDENHNDIEPACLTATIARAVPDVTAPAVRALVYNGSSQKLVTAGAAEGGTMQYALGTNDTTAPAEGWSTSIPKGTDAGTYYVWYRVQGDKNHTDIRPVCIVATVGAEVPKTGDDSSPLLWLGVILVGIMTIGVLRRAGFIGRKQNKGW